MVRFNAGISNAWVQWSMLVLLLVATTTSIAAFDPLDPIWDCPASCCCKVCSSTTNAAFPYGLTTVDIQTNPPNPQVIGASCHVPVWSDMAYNDSNGNPMTVPNTLFWTKPSYFGDNDAHVAPSTCTCCKLSVDTSCSEAIPDATRPKYLLIPSGELLTGTTGTIQLTGGVDLNTTDLIEIRNDTFCGYPNATARYSSFTVSADQTYVNLTTTMPAAGCYSLCYYHSGLTTPTWYLIDTFHVQATPAASITYTARSQDVLLAGNSVELHFSGRNLLSVFDDVVQLRTTACGSVAAAAATSGLNGQDIVNTVESDIWCRPAVTASITSTRPLRYIAIKYSYCSPTNRVYQKRTRWVATLPTVSTDVTYNVCYYNKGSWSNTGTLLVKGRRSQLAALQALYAALDGPNWEYNANWGGAVPCAMHGVRCDANGNVIKIFLTRKGLLGALPANFFLSTLAGTLTHFAVDMNNVTGVIPPEVGALKALTYLNLGFNQMTGTLPTQLLGCDSIDAVYLSNNNFQGEVPTTIDSLSLQWLRNNLTSPVTAAAPAECPAENLICSDRGSTDGGVSECGYSGILQEECEVRGCCFNAQAPLVFGGSTCFTKRASTYFTNPQCTAVDCVQQAEVVY